MKNIIIIILLFISSLNYAQWSNVNSIDYKLGFSLESSVLLDTKLYSNISKEESFTEFYPISFYLFGMILFFENLGIAIKPGLVLGGDYYSAFEFGFHIRYYFSDQKFFGSLGMNIHDNFGDTHGTLTYTSITHESVNLAGASIGYSPNSNSAFVLSYYYPLSNYEYYYISNFEGDSYSTKLNQIIKFGVEISY